LMHDIGQLWLYRFNPQSFREAWNQALAHDLGIEDAERHAFGEDHPTIGAWLAEHWGLPPTIVAAIHHHHACDGALGQPIVAITHIAEVLSNALDLTGRKENHVTQISLAACKSLGIEWNPAIRTLFGRIEARSRHANAFFEVH
jgi:HD-like signal output (HDOD) protein